MFGWRRRSEGFEWREYVRTTVLVRRADRQRRLDDARMAAVEKVKHVAEAGKDAGRAGAAFTGSQFVKLLSFIGAVLRDLAIAAFKILFRWLKFAFAVLSDALGRVARPLLDAAHIPTVDVRGKIEALKDRVIDVGAMKVGAMPKFRAMPDVARRLPIKSQHLIGAAAALALIYVGGPILRSGNGVADATSSANVTGSVTVSSDISGRAYAISGDVLRVDDTIVRLAGIEAPASRQPCYRSTRRKWNCASAAKSGLARIVHGHSVTCSPSGHDESGHVLASCVIDKDTNLAAELVRNGLVFAEKSFFGSLSSEEDAARDAKAGIWQGEVQRPQAWRDQEWADAKQAAPDGCPIKGFVRASTKYYTLPWSADYDRSKVSTERGGRWFCSEDEAKAAGFAPSNNSLLLSRPSWCQKKPAAGGDRGQT
jgi:endonuclease YncB( thermonuclease family)